MHDNGDVGYWIDGQHEGKGLESRAVHAMATAGFRYRDLNRVELRTAVDNRRSRALAERLDFVDEGTVRSAQLIGSQRRDLVIYGALADEWAGTRPADGQGDRDE